MPRANDPGRNLVRVASGIYKARWYEGPGGTKERRETLNTRSLAEARRRVRTVMAKVNAERYGHEVAPPPQPGPQKGGPTLADLLDLYRKSPRYLALVPSAVKRYEIEIRRMERFFAAEGIEPSAMDRNTVDDYVEHGREHGLSVSSIKNALTTLNQIWTRAEAKGLVSENPVERFKRDELGDDEQFMNPPLNGEADRLDPEIERLAPRLLELTRVLRWTGCRLTETLLLRPEDRTESDKIHLHQGVKMGRARYIRLNRAAEVLDRLEAAGARPGERYFADLPGNAAAVSSMFGSFWVKRREDAEAAALREGRPLTPWEARRWRLHDYRHEFAVEAMLAGADVFRLQMHLGHASVQMTMRYLKAMQRLPVMARGAGLRTPWQGAAPGTRAAAGPVDGAGPQPALDTRWRPVGGAEGEGLVLEEAD